MILRKGAEQRTGYLVLEAGVRTVLWSPSKGGDRDQALALVITRLCVARTPLPGLEQGRFYLHKLTFAGFDRRRTGWSY